VVAVCLLCMHVSCSLMATVRLVVHLERSTLPFLQTEWNAFQFLKSQFWDATFSISSLKRLQQCL
jgi:hypothetical protein